MQIGLDFGTTTTVVSVFDGAHVRLVPLDPSEPAPTIMRSVLLVSRSGEVMVGRTAIDHYTASNVGRAIEYARALGCRQLNCLAGIAPAGVEADKVHATLVANLRFAAARLEEAGIRLLVEPINTFDIPGFYLNRTAQAIALIEEVGSPNLWLQHDLYHMQRMEGELANTIAKHLPKIAHMQIADTPGRHEPGSGEINYAWLFRFIDQLGYEGWIGCEYKPAAGTREGLGWIRALAG